MNRGFDANCKVVFGASMDTKDLGKLLDGGGLLHVGEWSDNLRLKDIDKRPIVDEKNMTCRFVNQLHLHCDTSDLNYSRVVFHGFVDVSVTGTAIRDNFRKIREWLDQREISHDPLTWQLVAERPREKFPVEFMDLLEDPAFKDHELRQMWNGDRAICTIQRPLIPVAGFFNIDY